MVDTRLQRSALVIAHTPAGLLGVGILDSLVVSERREEPPPVPGHHHAVQKTVAVLAILVGLDHGESHAFEHRDLRRLRQDRGRGP